MNKILGIIPARSGSKGLKDKNILQINGKSMSSYTIEAAINSELFDDIYYCTDSEQYQKAASTYDIRVEPLRPKHLASDLSSSYQLLNWILESEDEDTWVILMQGTSPLRTEIQIKEAFALAKTNDCAVVSVVKTEIDPGLLWSVDDNKSISGLDSFNSKNYRRQNTSLYKPNGAIYIFKVGQFYKEETIFPRGIKAYEMDKETSVDVDDEIDFKLVEKIIEGRI